jgi:hypothetical protein
MPFVASSSHVIGSALSDLLPVADWIGARNNSQNRRRLTRKVVRQNLFWL